jgi:hypothetical protein
MAAISDPQGAIVIAWKGSDMLGAEVVNEPGAMTWNDLLTSDVGAARSFYAACLGGRLSPFPRATAATGLSRVPTGPTAG